MSFKHTITLPRFPDTDSSNKIEKQNEVYIIWFACGGVLPSHKDISSLYAVHMPPDPQTRTHLTWRCSVFRLFFTMGHCMYSCHDWNIWDFYLAVVPSTKPSATVWISWIDAEVINIFLQTGPWNCQYRFSSSSVQELNQKGVFAFSSRIIKYPRGRAGSVQTQARAWKIKVMEMWPSSKGSSNAQMEFSAGQPQVQNLWAKRNLSLPHIEG